MVFRREKLTGTVSGATLPPLEENQGVQSPGLRDHRAWQTHVVCKLHEGK
jgi:hypothetical protein